MAESTSKPSPQNTSERTTMSELRLGIALSGGIALVLYQSGVSHELLRFSNDNGAGAYKTAINRTGIHPILDIVTGASAGAINCVMLGHCLATGNSYKDFHDIWIEEADISKMRWPDGETPASLLHSRPLINKVKDAMTKQVGRPKPPHCAEWKCAVN
ncbi:MAG: patatin-like phospholipase family protein [Chthonomonadales bacterium]